MNTIEFRDKLVVLRTEFAWKSGIKKGLLLIIW